jgi:hypothetical protein
MITYSHPNKQPRSRRFALITRNQHEHGQSIKQAPIMEESSGCALAESEERMRQPIRVNSGVSFGSGIQTYGQGPKGKTGESMGTQKASMKWQAERRRWPAEKRGRVAGRRSQIEHLTKPPSEDQVNINQLHHGKLSLCLHSTIFSR